MTDHHEGPSRIYVPVCKHPRDFMFVFGPLEYEWVQEVGECPLYVTTDRTEDTRSADGPAKW